MLASSMSMTASACWSAAPSRSSSVGWLLAYAFMESTASDRASACFAVRSTLWQFCASSPVIPIGPRLRRIVGRVPAGLMAAMRRRASCRWPMAWLRAVFAASQRGQPVTKCGVGPWEWPASWLNITRHLRGR
jgi:hypothetical protein